MDNFRICFKGTLNSSEKLKYFDEIQEGAAVKRTFDAILKC